MKNNGKNSNLYQYYICSNIDLFCLISFEGCGQFRKARLGLRHSTSELFCDHVSDVIIHVCVRVHSIVVENSII